MKYTLIAFLVFLVTGELCGQEKYTKQELIRMVKEERFSEAYQPFESYLEKFPKDPDYIFYAAVCRVSLNTKVGETIDLLLEATKQGKYKESWFYLGRVYMLNYEFGKASEAFERFNDKASRDEKDRIQFAAFLAMCRNGIDICSKSKNLMVVRVDTIGENDLFSYLNKQPIKGKLEKKSEPGMFSDRLRTGVKFASAGKELQTKHAFGKKQKDIFLSEEEDIELDKSKPLGSIINSANEEDFVFYDETIPALYFSSMGHNSAGGYDIFKSYYDKPGKKWSKPVNLGFPINTPFDEVAYVTLPGTNKSLLASRRNENPAKLVVYTFENAEEAAFEEQIVTAHARDFAHLKPGLQNNASMAKSTSEKKNAVSNRNEVPAEIRNEQSYQRMIREALSLQIRSDSIKRISDEKKEQLVAAKFDSDKTRLWQEIKVLDSKADEIQQKADILYKKARELEAEKQEKINTQELAQKAFSSKNTAKSTNTKATEKPFKTQSGATEIQAHDIQYRIQVGVFSKPPPQELFRNFSDVFDEAVKDGIAVKYYVGLYRRIADAEKGLVKVKDSGFKDAFIIGYYNGKIVPLSRARELELSFQKQ
jgi:hypothetical protein